MKLIILACIIGACAAAALPGYVAPSDCVVPQHRYPYNYQDTRARASLDRNAAILRSDSEANEQGYQYSFDTENGIHVDETGVEGKDMEVAGSYSYTGDDGKVYSMTYTADANGFHPHASYLPTSPPLPEANVKALKLIAKDEAAGIFDDGSYHEAPGVVLACKKYPTK